MSLMSRNHIDLITFNRFIQGHFRLAGNHTLAQRNRSDPPRPRLGKQGIA
jgi:hypothetical protein